jgi:hypothetical protein
VPGRKPAIAGESQATACRRCVWGVAAQWVRDYGCTSNAPTSHLDRRSVCFGLAQYRSQIEGSHRCVTSGADKARKGPWEP